MDFIRRALEVILCKTCQIAQTYRNLKQKQAYVRQTIKLRKGLIWIPYSLRKTVIGGRTLGV